MPCRATSGPTRCWDRWCGNVPACACPVPWTVTRRRSVPSSASRSRWRARSRWVASSPTGSARTPAGGPGHARFFPSAATLAEADPESLPMPRARARALVGMCAALADGAVRSTAARTATPCAPGSSPCPGSVPGPPTTSPCGPSATPTSSSRPTSRSRGCWRPLGADPTDAPGLAEAWRPWRSYAVMQLWPRSPAGGPACPTPRRRPTPEEHRVSDLRHDRPDRPDRHRPRGVGAPVGDLSPSPTERSPRSVPRRRPRGPAGPGAVDDDARRARRRGPQLRRTSRAPVRLRPAAGASGTGFQRRVWGELALVATARPRRTAGRASARCTGHGARGRRGGQRPQPVADRRPLPPRRRRRRTPGGLRRGRDRKAWSARPRAGRAPRCPDPGDVSAPPRLRPARRGHK